MVNRVRGAWAALQRTRMLRAWRRFGDARGNVLAAGVAYFAFFSVFPAVALAFTALGVLASRSPQVYDGIVANLDAALPGFIKTADNPTGIIAVNLPGATALTWTGIVGLVGVVLAGAGWLSALQAGIRAVVGVPGTPGNAVTSRLRDVGVLVLLGLLVVGTVVTGSVLTAMSVSVADRLGLALPPAGVTAVGVLVGTVGHLATMVVVLRVLPGVELPWPDVRGGALLGGAALSIMTLFGGQLVALGVRNPMFGALVGVVGLLFWLNLAAKIVLLAASWAASSTDDERGQ